MESPFSRGWIDFGFMGVPDCGVSYSWTFIQDSLVFDGVFTSASSCSIFYSQDLPDFLMVRAPGMEDVLWEMTACIFTQVPNFIGMLKVSNEERFFYLWGVSETFLELLDFTRRFKRRRKEEPAQNFKSVPIKHCEIVDVPKIPDDNLN